MIPLDIETGTSASPGAYFAPRSRRTTCQGSRRRRRGVLLAPEAALFALALVLGATEAAGTGQGPNGRGDNQTQAVADMMPDGLTNQSNDADERCRCPRVWKCYDETTNLTHCTCSGDFLYEVNITDEPEQVSGDSDYCKEFTESCKFECTRLGLYCTDGSCKCNSSDGRNNCEDDLRLQFMTAAQIALGAALVVAVMALAVLLWKMCYRPRGNSRWSRSLRRRGLLFGRPNSESRDRCGSADDGTTNSIQNFVIQKMRDRPPRYEDAPPEMPPCYDEIIGGTISSSAPAYSTAAEACVSTSASWRTSGRMADAAPPYEPRESGGVSGHLRNASAQTSTRDAVIDTPEQSVDTTTDSQYSPSSTSAFNTLSDDGPEGIDNPAFVREVYEHHM